MAGRSQQRLNSWAWCYVIFIILLGAYTMFRLQPQLAHVSYVTVAAFATIIFVSEALPVELPRKGGTVSVSFAAIYAVMLLTGPEVATWLAALASLRAIELSGRVSLEKILFNRAQLALSAAAAGLVYLRLGGSPGHINVFRDAGALLGAAMAYSVVNITTVVIVMHLTQKVSFWHVWVTNFRWMIPHYLALTPLGVLIAVVQTDVGLAGVLLLLVPLMVARYSLQLYVEMRRAYLATIRAMIAAIEARDPYTAGHSRRVARFAVATARILHLSEDQIERLEYTAWLHDIGKLAVPDQILQKRGTLSAEEWGLMKQHPQIGASILKQIKLLGRDVDVILHHHERWNGEGYPDLLRGEDIPMGARLIAIADAYEAMTSTRPYRASARSKDEALDELRRCAGRQFDPALLDAFAKAVGSLPAEEEEGEANVAGFRPAPIPSGTGTAYSEAAAAKDAKEASSAGGTRRAERVAEGTPRTGRPSGGSAESN